MSSGIPNNFDPAHHYFVQSLQGVSNPLNDAFCNTRNSSVRSVKAFDRASGGDTLNRMQTANETLSHMCQSIRELTESSVSLAELRAAVEGMMNKAPIEPHADIFLDAQSDSNTGDDWDNMGSDEEVIVS